MSQSKNLAHLNLSWNTLFEFDKNPCTDIADDRFYAQSPTNSRSMDYVIALVKSANLKHLNLDGTGLTESMILLIGRAMRKSSCKTLLGIHLSNNLGTTSRVRDKLTEIIHGKRVELRN